MSQRLNKIKLREARLQSYYTKIQSFYDMSKVLKDTSNEISEFLGVTSNIGELRTNFMTQVEELNLLKMEEDAKFEPNFKQWESFDTLCSHVQRKINSLTAEEKGQKSIKLPPIQLLRFDGDAKSWPLFIESFNNVVHKNRQLSSSEKVYYLCGQLSGKALESISSIPPTGTNYELIYSTLVDKYQDIRSLGTAYLNEMFNLNKVQVPSGDNLDTFIDKFSMSISAFEKLEIANKLDFVFLYMALKKVDTDTARLFENSVRGEKVPTYQSFVKFVKEQAKILDRTSVDVAASKSLPSHSKVPTPRNFKPNVPPRNTRAFVTSGVSCPLCSSTDHERFLQCTEFLKLSANERYKAIKKNNGCTICLSFSHKAVACNAKGVCGSCHSSTHHTLLHFQNKNNTPGPMPIGHVNPEYTANNPFTGHTDVESSVGGRRSESTDVGVSLCSLHFVGSHTSTRFDLTTSSILLATARVCVIDSSGRSQFVRCLIDNGSQNHFITERCLKRLALPSSKLNVPISVHGFGGGLNLVKGETELVFSPHLNNNLHYKIRPLIVQCITNQLPTCKIDKATLLHLGNIPLADDTFDQPGEVDMLIGAQLFARLLLSGRVCGPPGQPDAIQTTLGFILMGEAPVLGELKRGHSRVLCALTSSPIDVVLRKFWELEEVPSSIATQLSREEQECETFYKTTTTRDPNGRYAVALPFKLNPQSLGSSLSVAEKRFFALENRLKTSTHFRTAYNNIIKEYLEQGYLTPVNNVKEEGYVIPHHGVIRDDKLTTKLRIVLDASASTNNGISLNQILHAGPNLQGDIFLILLNFRLFAIAFCADVKQMYLQIKVQPAYSKYLRILYRFDQNDKLQMFEFSRVCFGLSVSPFLALRTIKQLGEDEHRRFPLAANVLQSQLYMDDVVSSERSVSRAVEVASQLIGMFESGGFSLMKWSSNSSELLANLPATHIHPQAVIFGEDSSQKILGVRWEPKSDSFKFDISLGNRICTKRNILSAVARLWDILGFAAPVILYAKLLIQDLWALKIDWDEIPPQHIIVKWKQYQAELPSLSNISIPRHIGVTDGCVVTLLAFADASEQAYGCVIYLHIQTKDTVDVNLLCAKSKVAPLKLITLARLELCAALIMAKLVRTVLDNYAPRYDIGRVLAFSDSTVALHWIHSSPHRWKTFVSNRIAQIHENLDASHFYHVPGKDNPSDCLSRGLTPAQLENHPLWFKGPPWIQQKCSDWQLRPFKCDNTAKHDVEAKTIAAPAVHQELPMLYVLAHRISSWKKYLRVVVYVLRFMRKLTTRGFPTADDLNQAELVIIRTLQLVHFADIIKTITSGKQCSKQIQRLRPILVDGVLRVGGRLENSDVTFDHKHPILLPKKDHVVELIIDDVHRQNCHTGPHLLFSLIRQRFWILSGRNIVRSRVHACNTCFKVRPKVCVSPIMADLPKCRLQLSKPFAHTGLDYGGPINITLTRRRGVKSQKAYICTFICLTTRAVHVEVASDLSTDAFLNALKRFLSRRGPVERLYSDNGTNFVGARAYLNELSQFLRSQNYTEGLTGELAHQRIDWQMIPPNAPHFGGSWEATVKAFKTHLFRVIGAQILTYEELLTVLCQIEAVLNSRPLGNFIGSDPSEPVVLTPAHFLHNVPLNSLPAAEIASDTAGHLLSRYLLLDKLVQSYWRRWNIEYLHNLQAREKWLVDTEPIKKGIIVLIMQNNTPPLHWPLGVIQETYPGKDRRTRVVLVKTKTGTFMRPVVRLCPLPTQ